MFLDRSTRTVLAVILATAAVILGVNLVINPGGLTDSMEPLFLFLAGLAAIFWAWNWRESYALAHPKDDDDDDQAPVIPRVFAPALMPELEAPAVTLTDSAEAAAALSPIMAPVVAPVIAPASVSSAPHVNLDAAPAAAKAPEAVMPPAPAPSPAAPATPPSTPPTAPEIPAPAPATPPTPAPTPAPVTPPAPVPVEPPTPAPVEPPLPSPSEPSPPSPSEPPAPAPVEPLPAPAEPASQRPPIEALGADKPFPPDAKAVIPPVSVDLPQPLHTASVTDLASPAQKASTPAPTAAATITDAKNGEPVAAKTVGEAMAAPQQPDASVVQQTDPAPQMTVPESNATSVPPGASKSKNKGSGASKSPKASTASIPAPAASTPDDLTRIEGIGKYYSDALHKIGIDTFAQLAAEQHGVILTKLLAAGFRRHPTIPTWPEQAALAARGDWDGLKALQATLTGGRRA